MEEITIKIFPCECSECRGECYGATIKSESLDDSTGGYEDIESLLDNVGEIIGGENL